MTTGSVLTGKGRKHMAELYAEMRLKLKEFYENGKVTMDMELFFKLYKLVCDMKQIENVVKNL